jgi:hypothetical protein
MLRAGTRSHDRYPNDLVGYWLQRVKFRLWAGRPSGITNLLPSSAISMAAIRSLATKCFNTTPLAPVDNKMSMTTESLCTVGAMTFDPGDDPRSWQSTLMQSLGHSKNYQSTHRRLLIKH